MNKRLNEWIYSYEIKAGDFMKGDKRLGEKWRGIINVSVGKNKINAKLKVGINRMNYNYLRYMFHIARQGNLKSKAIAFIVSQKLSHKSQQESIKIYSDTATNPSEKWSPAFSKKAGKIFIPDGKR
jgi:hypothetical protein